MEFAIDALLRITLRIGTNHNETFVCDETESHAEESEEASAQ